MKAFMNYVICDAFERATGIKALPLKPYSRLDLPVCAHADMLLCIIDNRLFCYSDYYLENKAIFDEAEKSGYKIIKCAPPISSKYPHDIGLNVVVMGKKIFGNVKYICKEIVDYCKESGYELINVRQGYTACSTLVLDEKNVVTGDISIKNSMEKEGVSVLLTDDINIVLLGYDHGFIGGSTGVLESKILVFGETKKLADSAKIKTLADTLKMDIFSILSGDVVDFGGIKVIK
jgi:hypothetical protein